MKTLFWFLYLSLILTCSLPINAQTEFTCANKNYDFLKKAIGRWEVQTTDRISPDIYEENEGVAFISDLIAGCGIKISYRGVYKNKPYAREVNIIGLDSTNVQMVALDSEHGSFSFLDGNINNGTMELIWYRNKQIGRLRSKYIMTFESPDSFEFSSFISTDHGENWALTHKRIYSRAE